MPEKAMNKALSKGGYERLVYKAQTDGEVRLIIRIDHPFTPMGHLSEGHASLQQANIARGQSDLLNSLSGQKIRHLHSFKHTPQMVVITDKAGLDALLSHDSVLSIHEDIPRPYNLFQSTPRVGAPILWSQSYNGKNVYVAILDTGVDKSHPFLSDAIVSEACYSSTGSGDGYTYQSICPGGVTDGSTAAGSALPYAGSCPAGECDHGTHVAGIAGGWLNSSYSGVANGVGIIAIQVFSRFDSYAECYDMPCALAWDSDIIRGLERVYALRNTYNIAAVNMSLGSGRYTGFCDSEPMKPYIDNLRSANIATVVSAGNDGYKNALGFPACISSTISVGASVDSDSETVADYSNSSALLSLLAPGSGITSSIPGGGYEIWNGTSMAAPHVTGAWALLRQARPAVGINELLAALQATGVGITDTNGITKYRIQINSALGDLDCPTPPVKRGSSSYFSSIQTAYDGAVSGRTLSIQSLNFFEDLSFTRNIVITLKGGYGCNYASNPVYSILNVNAPVVIRNGTVIAENLIIR